jgi:hypothetical protein
MSIIKSNWDIIIDSNSNNNMMSMLVSLGDAKISNTSDKEFESNDAEKLLMELASNILAPIFERLHELDDNLKDGHIKSVISKSLEDLQTAESDICNYFMSK